MIYINDLADYVDDATTSMYADDTNLTACSFSVEELETNLNRNLDKIHQWLISNKLTLSEDKSEYKIIGSRQRLSTINSDPQVKLENHNIKRVKRCKALGVIIDEKLLWNDQIENTVSKVSEGFGILLRLRSFIPNQKLISIYKSLVLPQFYYCSLLWENCSVQLLEKLQKMQSRAARIITGQGYETRSGVILRNLQRQSLHERRHEQKLQKVIFMYKIKK